MAKQNWKPGNMLYPLPAVMVSCQSSTAHDPLCERPELDGKPNIITVAWAVDGLHQSADGFDLRPPGALLLSPD